MLYNYLLITRQYYPLKREKQKETCDIIMFWELHNARRANILLFRKDTETGIGFVCIWGLSP